MTPVKNGRVIYNEMPTGYPIPGKTIVYDETQTIDLDTVQLNGGILVKILVLSVDPYLRRKMYDPKIPSAFGMFTVGDLIDNGGVGVVLRSENAAFKPGDHVYAIFPFQEYVVFSDTSRVIVLENKQNLPWSVYIGVCGLPGMTGHHGWKEYAHPKKGDIVFITAASGPVGATVVQLAKADGLKVIASAGSDEKVEFVKSIGADVVFNYKTVSYWDNVGGEALEAALEFADQHATFVICGNISGYNTTEPYNVKNLQQLVWREITFYGFLVGSIASKYAADFEDTFLPAVASGEIKYLEHHVRGLENAGQAIYDVQCGNNIGKSVIVMADE